MRNTVVKKEKKKKSLGYTILMILFIGVFLVSAGYLVSYFGKNYIADNDFKKMPRDISKLKEDNPDFIGWLTIEDTKIDYPVMHTPSDPEFYLRKNFKKEYSYAGSPFLDGLSDLDKPTYNWMIHGHNIKAGTMFADLVDFRKQEFLNKHPYLWFETIQEGKVRYKIVAVLETKVYTEETDKFEYYSWPGIDNKSQYEDYVNGFWNNAKLKVGEKPTFPAQVITLSTCAYHTEDGRIAIMAIKDPV